MFVFNDGALCWGFPHFLPLIVLIPRGTGGPGPDWVGYTVPAKLQMISLNSSRMSPDWKQARARCVVSIRRERESVKSLRKKKKNKKMMMNLKVWH